MSGETDVTAFEIEPFVADEVAKDVLPYPGLRPFKKSEHRFFFGRSDQVAEILEILAQQGHFVTAIGPSGCGKSSLIRAGVQSALEFGLIPSAGQRWVNAKMRPGDAPLAHLRDALVEVGHADAAKALDDMGRARLKAMLGRGRGGLARFFELHPLPAGRRLLLLIDQFEELFRYDIPRSDAGAFVSLLVELFHEPLEQVFVILTMRTDYIGDCTRFLGLAEVVNRTFYLIPPLNRAQLAEAISRPALEVGGRVDPELVDRLLLDMRDSDDPLPLVQHALMWMWIRARQQCEDAGTGPETPIELSRGDYERVGGLSLALSDHADHVIDSAELGPNAARDAELFFRQLVQRDDGRYIRRPAKVAEIIESTRSGDEAKPLLDIEALRALVKRLAGDNAGFIFVQTESATGDESPEPTEQSTIDIGHEALIRQWSSLRGWARAETDTGDRMKTLTKEAVEWHSGGRGLLDKLALETYGKAWQGLWRLFTGGGVAKRGWFPPRRWAGRYVSAAAQGPRHGGLEHSLRELYDLGHDFWTSSKKRRRWIRTAKVCAVFAVGGLPLLGLFAASVAEQKSAFEQIEGEIAATFNRSLVLGKYRDAPAFRAMAKDAGDRAAEIETETTLPLEIWLHNGTGESAALARDLKDLYLDLADLHGIGGKHWPAARNDGQRQADAPFPGPVLMRSPSNLHVPIASATHFKGPDSADCIAVLDAVGELSVACDKGNGEKPSALQPMRLHSSLAPAPDATSIVPACFQPGADCPAPAVDEWFRLTRIARREINGQLLAVAPDRSVHFCRIETDEAKIVCEESVALTRHLRELGDPLRGLTIDSRGRYLAAIHWGNESDDRVNSDWNKALENHHLFRLSLLDLSKPLQTAVPTFRLSAKDDWRFTADISRFPEQGRAAVAIWLQEAEDGSGELTLTAAFDASILFQWRLPQQGQTTDIPPLRSAKVHLGKPILAAASRNGGRAVLTGLNRPLTFFDLARTSILDLPVPAEIGAHPQNEWMLLKAAPTDLKFVDDDMIAVSDSQANAFLIPFGPADSLRLDPPSQFGLPTNLFVIDNEEPVIYGIAPDREKGTHILRWDTTKGDDQRAMRIRVPLERLDSAETVVAQRQRDWRMRIDAMAEGGIAGVYEVPAVQGKKADTAPAGGCWGAQPEPLARYALPGNRLWIAVCGNGTVKIFARKPGRSNDSRERFRMVALLKDPLTGPASSANLYCQREPAPGSSDLQAPEGCWLVTRTLELFSMQPRSLDVVYHFPRA